MKARRGWKASGKVPLDTYEPNLTKEERKKLHSLEPGETEEVIYFNSLQIIFIGMEANILH